MTSTSTRQVLVVDGGPSSVRVGIFDADGEVRVGLERELLPESPADGIVQFDARAMADTCLELATRALEQSGPVSAVGISNQRGSTILWDRASGEPVGPGI